MDPMENDEQRLRVSVLPSPAELACFAFLREIRGFLLLVMVLWLPLAGHGDSYDAALDQRFAEPKGSTNEMRASTTDTNLVSLEQALKVEQQRRSEGPPVPPPEAPIGRTGFVLLAVLLLAAILAFLRIIKLLNDQLKNGAALSKEAMERALKEKLVAEEPTQAAFFGALRTGLETSDGDTVVGIPLSAGELGGRESKEQEAHRLQVFFNSVPGQIAAIRAQLSKISAAPDSVCIESFRELYRRVDVIKQKSGMSALRPVWLLTCGLEGLIQQITTKTTNANASVLRTIAGAVDLLKALCVPSLDPALATRTPVELLVVDDNPVCLAAVSMALRKAFRKPDLAPEGFSALALAEKKRYDVILLDIDMPGMDGFELCTKIRNTDLNRTTPVVFVTSHGDFESRTRSALVGGEELIAKPFHSFEITVKALTLALSGRLATDAAALRSEAKAAPDSGGGLVLSALSASPLPSEG
jgi:CheY-like chemotaxis protein